MSSSGSSTLPERPRSAMRDGLEVLKYEEGTPEGDVLNFLSMEGLRGARLAKPSDSVPENETLLPVYFGVGGKEVLRVMPGTLLSNIRHLLEWKRVENETFKLLVGGTVPSSLDVPLREQVTIIASRESGPRSSALEAARRGQIPWGFEDDREVVLTAVRKDGRALERASMRLAADRWVVLAAVRNDADALIGRDTLRRNYDLMLAAVSTNRDAFRHASPSLKNDAEFVREVMRMYPSLLGEASNAARRDREIVLEAVKLDASVLEYADASLRDDEAFVDPLLEFYNTLDPCRQRYIAMMPAWYDILRLRDRAPAAGRKDRKRPRLSMTGILDELRKPATKRRS
jgi:hypothetical protein